MSKIKFLLHYTSQFRWWYAGGLIFLGLTIWASVTIPGYIQKSVDLIAYGREASQDQFLSYIIAILLLAVALIFVRTLSRILFFIPGRLIERQLKGEMFTKLTSFGKDYFDRNTTGSVISRLNNDINGVRMITGFGLLQTGNIILSLSVTPYKMWKMSPELTLYSVIPLIIIFVIVRVGMVIMVKNTRNRMAALQSLSGKVVSFLSGASVIKSYNIYSDAERRVHKDNVALFGYTLNIAWIRSFIIPLLASIEQILKVVILFAGGMFVINGTFSIGQLTEYIAYAALLAHPVMGLGWVLTVMQQGFVGVGSLQTIMNRKGADDGRKSLLYSQKKELFDNGIKINNLSYSYQQGELPVISDISFDIKPGEIIGITGPLGSGKTTLINCINGYLRAGKGKVFFGDVDSDSVRIKDIAASVRTVTQDVFLFSDTIENNIYFGSNDSFDSSKFKNVLYQSALSHEIEKFPKTEKTMVGEKGIMLSGGQKQRISLARALYSECDLLILDDVFSAVDTDTERFIIEQLFSTSNVKSMIFVSTRISVLERTDRIIVLDNGRKVDEGTHDQLKRRAGFYRDTLNIQEES
ncbi:ABC transporter ATP-binding protein [Marinilabiliaceae bacterium ANBcel2]|nr:ABC transporter ATP-binding protein [Marinilabiliaceae bacterium ANBcel2]